MRTTANISVLSKPAFASRRDRTGPARGQVCCGARAMKERQQLSEMEAVMVAGAIIGVLWVSLGYLVVSFW
jgi:hypothetical protein